MVLAPAPLNRPAGSTQVLRYRGQVGTVVNSGTVYQQANMKISAANATLINANAQFEAWVRFALFDPNDPYGNAGLGGLQRTYPGLVYDNSQPAGAAPQSLLPISFASTNPGVNTTDQIANFETWGQNVEIHENRIDSNVLIADVGLSVNTGAGGTPGAFIMADVGASSGLGTNTGLYVACIRFVVNSTGGLSPAIQAFNVDLTFEIRHTTHR